MITKEQINKILEESVNAPSGDNSQPWRFRVHGNNIDIVNIDRDRTIFNFHNRGDYIAHGALIENIDIVSAEYGIRTSVVVFPEGAGKGATATITLVEGDGGENLLYQVVQKRATNRKPYSKKSLSAGQKEVLDALNGHYESATIAIVDSREGVSRVARAVSLNERLILENKTIRDFLFSIIRWTKREEREKPGMYVRTLELAPPQRMAFRLFQIDILAGIAKKLGFPKVMQKEGVALYEASGAMGLIAIKKENAEEFVQAGRLFERVWLSATKNGLSIQPLAAIPYLAQRIKEGEAKGISQSQIVDVLSAEKEIRNVFDVADGYIIAMLFRIGEGEPPSACSTKLAPIIEWKN